MAVAKTECVGTETALTTTRAGLVLFGGRLDRIRRQDKKCDIPIVRVVKGLQF
jgi:hypothetical protein